MKIHEFVWIGHLGGLHERHYKEAVLEIGDLVGPDTLMFDLQATTIYCWNISDIQFYL